MNLVNVSQVSKRLRSLELFSDMLCTAVASRRRSVRVQTNSLPTVQVVIRALLSILACAACVPVFAQTPEPSAEVSAGAYIIGPGDTLQVFVWRNPELSVSVPVRPDGRISTPLVEDMVAVGKRPSELARDMEKVLAEYVRSPQVNVIVTEPVSTFSQIKIIGQVAKPQALPYREGMTVLDAVLAVGGLDQFAAGNRSKVVRTEAGKQKEIRIKLEDLLNRGDMRTNIALRPGDVLVVPESRF